MICSLCDVKKSYYSGYLKGRPSLELSFPSIYLSIYRRVMIIYADVMHVIDTFTKTRRRLT